jgi:hypothetical protein
MRVCVSDWLCVRTNLGLDYASERHHERFDALRRDFGLFFHAAAQLIGKQRAEHQDTIEAKERIATAKLEADLRVTLEARESSFDSTAVHLNPPIRMPD